ncbi:response regulator [Thalassomonas sp. RHCl1]|uniref:response regulator n=1 Tax=Thalassomonas sp. RHCl1 TaxID=2995320 RepID=UPI00248BDAD9|nr:response regulator [Thalassomonas sp. RHCl1]
MRKQQILIVEDEMNIAEVQIAYCKNAGFAVTHMDSGKDVVSHVKNNQVDLILLDLMLPDSDGITLCKEIRMFSQVAIIMVTAKNEEIDRLLGLELGADDYICKPFSPREMIARVKGVLRRVGVSAENLIKQSGFALEPDKYQVSLFDQALELTPIEFRLLEKLLTNSHRVYSRQALIDSVYTASEEVSDRNIDTHIKNIRRKISNIKSDYNPIVSVYGVGYRFDDG